MDVIAAGTATHPTKRYSGVDQGPAEIGRPEPLKAKVQPDRDGGRCRGEGNQKETHVVSNEENQDGVTPSCFSRSSRRSSSSYAPLYPEDAPSSARKPALLDSQ
jgi:hypothetical protein